MIQFNPLMTGHTKMSNLLGRCVMVARQTLDLFVLVRTRAPQPGMGSRGIMQRLLFDLSISGE